MDLGTTNGFSESAFDYEVRRGLNTIESELKHIFDVSKECLENESTLIPSDLDTKPLALAMILPSILFDIISQCCVKNPTMPVYEATSNALYFLATNLTTDGKDINYTFIENICTLPLMNYDLENLNCQASSWRYWIEQTINNTSMNRIRGSAAIANQELERLKEKGAKHLHHVKPFKAIEGRPLPKCKFGSRCKYGKGCKFFGDGVGHSS